ncbi:MAG: DNA repair protein RecO, partial [Gammaproteobacteria bacterium]
MQIDNPLLEPAYILHYRAYRDTSLIVEFFTKQHGRITAVAKAARSSRSPWRGLLSPGIPLLITCVGKHELLTLTQAEPDGSPLMLQGKALFSLFYVNELVMHLLHRFDSHVQLYEQYAQTLTQLATASQIEIPLRIFEWKLLQELGYGLALDKDIH